MYKKGRVEPLPHPRHKSKDFSVPKTPKIPKEPTEEEIKEHEENLEKLWKHVHGHKLETAPPKKRKAKIIKY